MIKNLLIYKWGAYSDQAVIRNLNALGYHCVEFTDIFNDYHADAAFAQKVLGYIEDEKIDMIFSWNYFPLLASLCEIRKIPYVIWTCDCPLHSLMSKTVLYEHNFFFCFDRLQAEQLANLGCKNVYHYPLAVDSDMFEAVISSDHEQKKYAGDISFVGRLYTEKERWLDAKGIAEYTKGYVEGIVEAQLKVYGYNFVKSMISEDMAEEILEKNDLKLGEMYFSDSVWSVAGFVNTEVTRRERQDVINTISKNHVLNLYSTSKYQGNGNTRACGTVDYQTQMPLVFHNSKINLNITSKSIESGIPLRVLDILACGGFCLTNYQPEIAENFEDGVQLVMYTSMEDLAHKAEYYLQHEEERKAIAQGGYKKIKELFDLKEKLSLMIQIVKEEVD